ncbi:unnamed protein product [Calypogeia fissa]
MSSKRLHNFFSSPESAKKPKCAESSSSAAGEPKELNDHVFQVYAPENNERPSVEIVFFHGLQLRESDNKPHLTTWKAAEASESLFDLIQRDFPKSRLLTVLYDARVKQTNRHGRITMYQLRENLVRDLIVSAYVGQDGCPVILVGHCVGGLVMKEMCLHAEKLLLQLDKRNTPVKNFLNHLKGLFFYATPHGGTKLADQSKESVMPPLFEYVKTYNNERARTNDDFWKLRKARMWETRGIMASCRVNLGAFKDIVVSEGSARHDVDSFYTAAEADHFTVCQPTSKSSSFQKLSELVSKVVDEDERRMGPKISFKGKSIIGLHDQVNSVQTILVKAQRVGVVGMGGIGKTTLVKKVFNTISGEFEFTCFLENVNKDFVTVEDADYVRAKIKQHLYFKGRPVDDDFEWDELKGKKVLIVLDSVDSYFPLMTESDGFSVESRVIVTTRDSGCLNSKIFEFHFMMELNKHDSKALFCLHAFEQHGPLEDFEEQVEKFLEICGGYPLALFEAGACLHKKTLFKAGTCHENNKTIWDQALIKMRRVQPIGGASDDNLVSTLTSSYTKLAEPEQKMFLDVAIFFHEERLIKAEKIWDMHSWDDAKLTWKNLRDRGLVREAQDLNEFSLILEMLGLQEKHTQDRVIRMHKLLCKLGLKMNKDSQLPSDRTRPWREEYQENYKLAIQQSAPSIEVLKVFQRIDEKTDHIQFRNLDGLSKLRILWLDAGRFEGEIYVSFPSLVYLKITRVHWVTCSVNETSSHRSNEYGKFKYLEIESCEGLETLPSFLGQLEALTHLTICRCPKLRDLSFLSSLLALNRLEIAECPSLESLPSSMKKLQALEELEIVDCGNFVSPDFVESLGQLQSLKRLVISLEIRDSKNAGVLQGAIWQLPALKHLDIRYRSPSDVPSNDFAQQQTDQFTRTQANIGTILQDEEVVLSRDLEYFKISAEIGAGDIVEVLPESLGELQALKLMCLTGTTSLKSLPRTLGRLKALQILVLQDCRDLKKLPNSLGDLEALQSLTIKSCNSLEALPDTIGQLKDLKHLHIEAPGLTDLPEAFGKLKCLEYLQIYGGKDQVIGMKALPNCIWQLHALKRLELRSFFHLESLPESINELRSLEHLTVHGFARLKRLPKTLGELQVLRELEMSDCPHIDALPQVVGLQSLKQLKIWRCPKIQLDEDKLHSLNNFRSGEPLEPNDMVRWYKFDRSETKWQLCRVS